MWIFLNDSFFSVVEDVLNPLQFSVRARHAGDIEKVFFVKTEDVIVSTHTDYRFRVFLPKTRVIRTLAEEMSEIRYTNFKDSIAREDKSRHDAYVRVWMAMDDWQSDEYPNPVKDDWFKTYKYNDIDSITLPRQKYKNNTPKMRRSSKFR